MLCINCTLQYTGIISRFLADKCISLT